MLARRTLTGTRMRSASLLDHMLTSVMSSLVPLEHHTPLPCHRPPRGGITIHASTAHLPFLSSKVSIPFIVAYIKVYVGRLLLSKFNLKIRHSQTSSHWYFACSHVLILQTTVALMSGSSLNQQFLLKYEMFSSLSLFYPFPPPRHAA